MYLTFIGYGQDKGFLFKYFINDNENKRSFVD